MHIKRTFVFPFHVRIRILTSESQELQGFELAKLVGWETASSIPHPFKILSNHQKSNTRVNIG